MGTIRWSDGPTPLELVLEKESWEQVEVVLAELPDDEAEVARLRLRGWKMKEVVEHLGLAVRTAERYWTRAREALRERFGGLDG